jgi:hypothetical protein
VNTHERQRNLRRRYTICYTTSRRCFVIAVPPRPSANPECRVLEHQPVGSSPSPGKRTASRACDRRYRRLWSSRSRIGDRSPMVIGHNSFRSQVPTGSCWTVDMTQPGPNPDNYPPIDPTEPVPDDPGPLSPDTPETLPPAPVEPMPGPDDPDSVPASIRLTVSQHGQSPRTRWCYGRTCPIAISDGTRTHTHINHERTNTNSAFYPFRGYACRQPAADRGR